MTGWENWRFQMWVMRNHPLVDHFPNCRQVSVSVSLGVLSYNGLYPRVKQWATCNVQFYIQLMHFQHRHQCTGRYLSETKPANQMCHRTLKEPCKRSPRLTWRLGRVLGRLEDLLLLLGRVCGHFQFYSEWSTSCLRLSTHSGYTAGTFPSPGSR